MRHTETALISSEIRAFYKIAVRLQGLNRRLLGPSYFSTARFSILFRLVFRLLTLFHGFPYDYIGVAVGIARS